MEIKNKCPECLSSVEKPLIKRTHCEGPYLCLSNEEGKHTHVDSLCPFCGYVFLSMIEKGWK